MHLAHNHLEKGEISTSLATIVHTTSLFAFPQTGARAQTPRK
jgi:hypothetical protein